LANPLEKRVFLVFLLYRIQLDLLCGPIGIANFTENATTPFSSLGHPQLFCPASPRGADDTQPIRHAWEATRR